MAASADQIALGATQRRAGCPVDAAVAEIDHGSVGSAEGLQQHLGIEHAVGAGLQQGDEFRLAIMVGCDANHPPLKTQPREPYLSLIHI